MNDTLSTNEQIMAHFGGERRPTVFRKLADHEALLSAIWRQYRSVMAEGEIDVPTKELMGLCVGVAKPNDYIIGLQQRQVRYAGIDEASEREALAVAGFFEGFDSFVHALHIDSDLRPRRLEAEDTSPVHNEIDVNVPYVVKSEDPIVCQVYEEILAEMQIPFVPNVFRAMVHQPATLLAKWGSYKALMLNGVLRRRDKELIAIVVSAVNGCSYCVDAHSVAGRQEGLSYQGLVEAACVVDLFTNLCTLAKGFRLGKRDF